MPRFGQHILFITLSGLHYDVAQAAFVARRLPVLARYLPSEGWESRGSAAIEPYVAHQALFAGFLPVLPRQQLRSDTSRDKGWLFATGNMVTGLAAQGYKTICIGGVDCFDMQTPLGQILPDLFEVREWCAEFAAAQPDSTTWQIACALHHLRQLHEQPVLLFLNVSAISASDSLAEQQAALEYVDAALAPLFAELEYMGGAFTMICADHHVIYSEQDNMQWQVPYAEFDVAALGRRKKMIEISFNGADMRLGFDAEAQFALCLERFAEHEQFELWLNVEHGPAIAMLRYQGFAYLMYLRDVLDAGFVSLGNAELEGFVQFQLANGQRDEYPLSWCIDFDLCYKALAYFFANNGAQAEWVTWERLS